MTIAEYVEKRIAEIFLEVAEMVNSGEIEVDQENAGGAPFLIFRAQTAMLGAWQRFVEEEEGE